MATIPRIKEGNWKSVDIALRKLSTNVLGFQATPTFSGLTLTGLTGSRLISTNASKALTSVGNLADWVAGTTGLTVTDDTDGTITVSTNGVLEDLNTLGAAASDGEFIVATGAGAFAYESDNTARTSLGLGEGDSPTLTGLTVSGLTASRLMATDVSSGLASVADLTSWVAGTTNQITVADDLDGTITLATPQDIHTGASPTFVDLTLSTPSSIYSLDHDSFSGFVANEHIDHTAVTLTAGIGLTGGGDISANRTFTVDLNELATETTIASGDFLAMVDITDSGSGKITFANLESTLNHDSLAGFVANEHIDHTAVTLTAGTGLTGGGDISANRTFAVDGVLEDLDTLGAASADGEFIVATGAGVFAYESGDTARTSLGLGEGDSPTFVTVTNLTTVDSADFNASIFQLDRATTTDGDTIYHSWLFDHDGSVTSQGSSEFGRMTVTAAGVTEDSENGLWTLALQGEGSLVDVVSVAGDAANGSSHLNRTISTKVLLINESQMQLNLALVKYIDSSNWAGFAAHKARGTEAAPAVAQAGDDIGGWSAKALAGTAPNDWDLAGYMFFEVGPSPAPGDMPGNWSVFLSPEGSTTPTRRFTLNYDTNIGFNGAASWGTSAAGVGAWLSGTAPTTSPADCFQMWSEDFAAGNACPNFRTEDGTVITLNQNLATDANLTFAELSLGTGELTAGSINRASGTLTLEIGGTGVIDIASTQTKFSNGGDGVLWLFDEHHSIYGRPAATNYMRFYEYGGNVGSGGYEFFTGGLRSVQTRKLAIGNDFIYADIPVKLATIKSGATQGGASAAANELWKTASHATLPDNVVMVGV